LTDFVVLQNFRLRFSHHITRQLPVKSKSCGEEGEGVKY
jgi:hypothetical protein